MLVDLKTLTHTLRQPLSYLLLPLLPRPPQTWVLQEVINSRLFKLSRDTDPPFANGAVSDEGLTATTGSLVLSAVAMEGA